MIINHESENNNQQSYKDVKSIKPTNEVEKQLLNDVLTKDYSEIIVNIDPDYREMLKLVIFLMDLDVNIIVLSKSSDRYKLQQLLGISVINSLEELTIVSKQPLNTKNTIPNINKTIEDGVLRIENYLEVDSKLDRFIAMQILYENPCFQRYLHQNSIIEIIKEDVDYKLANQTVETIDSNIETFINTINLT